MAEFDILSIQPTMRKTVQWLRRMDFETTDSGDGVTNVEAGMEGALDVPHVFMVTERESAFEAAEMIWAELAKISLDLREEVDVQLLFSPRDGKVILVLIGVDDAVLASGVSLWS